MSKRFHRQLLIMLPLISVAIFASGQSVHALTVQDALELAKKNNIQVKTAQANLSVQEQTNKQLTADALPNSSATGTQHQLFSDSGNHIGSKFVGPGVRNFSGSSV